MFFEELLRETGVKPEKDKNGIYIGMAKELADVCTSVIISEDEKVFKMPWEEQKKLMKQRFYEKFPELKGGGPNFSRLTMTEESSGKETVLYENGEFKNFNYLQRLVGKAYNDVNDELMDGICESNDYSLERVHHIYENGAVVETLRFRYEEV